MKKIAFFIVGKKGFKVLETFIERFGSGQIIFVKAARDIGLQVDWFDQIQSFCKQNSILFVEKHEHDPVQYDYAFAIGWRWIFKDYRNLIVFHDSILPKYRGFAPLVSMLINGEKSIGVTALLASKEYDKGEIIHQEKLNIDYPLKISEALDKSIALYEKIAVKTMLDIIRKDTLNGYEQNEELASYSLWRNEKDYYISWTKSAEYIKRFIDAVGFPYLGAATVFNGKTIRIFDAQVVNDVYVESRKEAIGKIIFLLENHPVIVCGEGLLKVTNIKSDHGKVLLSDEIPFRTRFGE